MALATPTFAQTDANPASGDPLSAIDWLSESVEQPQTVASGFGSPRGSDGVRVPPIDEPPIAETARAPDVTVQSLNRPAARSIGLLSSATTGLPNSLWARSDVTTLAALLTAEEIETLPALQSLMITLLLADAAPPLEAATPGLFFQARVDKLLEFGALEEAEALLNAAAPHSPNLFRRVFDVSLLTGTENAACRALAQTPDVAPTPAARIFCLARLGDWSAAALTLNTGVALGDIQAPTSDLLARFLDPDLFEGEPEPQQPDTVTPLTFRMFEAIGAPLSTAGLPRAFAHSELRPNVGWKAQLEAAERLAESGAVDTNVLVDLYTERRPAASGGVWERAAAVSALQAALADPDETALHVALEQLWHHGQSVGIVTPVARHFSQELLTANHTAQNAGLVFKTLLLTSAYEEAALQSSLADTDPFLAALAMGDPTSASIGHPHHRLLRDAFAAEPDQSLMALAADDKLGEAILRTIATLQQGLDGDEVAFRDGIATLRALGLEDVARQTALQSFLLRQP